MSKVKFGQLLKQHLKSAERIKIKNLKRRREGDEKNAIKWR